MKQHLKRGVRMGALSATRNGKTHSCVPYGLSPDLDGPRNEKGEPERFNVNLDEQKVIRRIRELRRHGRSLRKIAAQLDKEGYPARNGRWRYDVVQRVLKRNPV